MNRDTFNSFWSPIDGAPAQDAEELFWLVNKVEGITPLNNILEIGVARGGSLRYWERIVPPKLRGGLVIGIEQDQTVSQQIEEWWDWKKTDRELGIVIGDSLNQKVIKEVEKILDGRELDFLFIDGNHDPEWIFKEFVTYGEMVRFGGAIAFHDIRPEMHLQYVFDKLRGRTERFFRTLGIGLYWKEVIDLSIVAQRHNQDGVVFDLDKPQADRLGFVWNTLKFDHWRK